VTLSAEWVDRVRRDAVRLSWTDAPWSQVWVYRNDVLIAQTYNDGVFTDRILEASGIYAYTVCAPDATSCSNVITASF
jgi:hypothetical protein